jgi:hypothetical protein
MTHYCFYCGEPGTVINNKGVFCSDKLCVGWENENRYCCHCGDLLLPSRWVGGHCDPCMIAQKYSIPIERLSELRCDIGRYKLRTIRNIKRLQEDTQS